MARFPFTGPIFVLLQVGIGHHCGKHIILTVHQRLKIGLEGVAIPKGQQTWRSAWRRRNPAGHAAIKAQVTPETVGNRFQYHQSRTGKVGA